MKRWTIIFLVLVVAGVMSGCDSEKKMGALFKGTNKEKLIGAVVDELISRENSVQNVDMEKGEIRFLRGYVDTVTEYSGTGVGGFSRQVSRYMPGTIHFEKKDNGIVASLTMTISSDHGFAGELPAFLTAVATRCSADVEILPIEKP